MFNQETAIPSTLVLYEVEAGPKLVALQSSNDHHDGADFSNYSEDPIRRWFETGKVECPRIIDRAVASKRYV